MNVHVECPHCKWRMPVDTRVLGPRTRCEHCHRHFRTNGRVRKGGQLPEPLRAARVAKTPNPLKRVNGFDYGTNPHEGDYDV